MEKITEKSSSYRYLEKMSTMEVLNNINNEDAKVSVAVRKIIPELTHLIENIKEKMLKGGRLIYIGAGTSGRLGVVDASEIPPTYGVSDRVIGIMAGGDKALRYGIEEAEDNEELGWEDLQKYDISNKDVVIGIAASGTTPYVIGGLRESRRRGITTGCIVCNLKSPVAQHANFPIEIIVGPEFVTGSTRMKSGTAQKLVLNMISTAVMIKIGRVYDNQMVNMQISNQKLIERGTKMLAEKIGIGDYAVAKKLLLQYGSVDAAIRDLKDSENLKS